MNNRRLPPFPPVLIGKGSPALPFVITETMGGKPGTPYEAKIYAQAATPERVVKLVSAANHTRQLRIWKRKGFRWRELSLAKVRLM